MTLALFTFLKWASVLPHLYFKFRKPIKTVYCLSYSVTILGVNFKDLIPKTPVKLEDLSDKILAIDAYNAIYQFLSIIRQPDGTPLKDSTEKSPAT